MNVISNILSIRNKLLDSISNQDFAFDAIANLDTFTGTISDGVGGVLGIDIKSDIVRITDEVTSSTLWEGTHDQFESYMTSDDSSAFKSFLLRANQAKGTNEIITQTLDMFTTSAKVKLSRLNEIVNNSTLLDDMKANIKAAYNSIADQDDVITIGGYSGILNDLFQKCFAETDDGQVALDQTEITYYNNFLGTVILGVIHNISTLASALLAMVTPLLGAVAFIISNIFERIGGFFDENIRTAIKVLNPEALVPYFEGPIESSVTHNDRELREVPDGIIGQPAMKALGCLDMYSFLKFKPETVDDQVNRFTNCFLTLNLNSQRVRQFFNENVARSSFHIDGQSNDYGVKFTRVPGADVDHMDVWNEDQFYLNAEQQSAMIAETLSGSDEKRFNIFVDQLVAHGLLMILNQLSRNLLFIFHSKLNGQYIQNMFSGNRKDLIPMFLALYKDYDGGIDYSSRIPSYYNPHDAFFRDVGYIGEWCKYWQEGCKINSIGDSLEHDLNTSTGDITVYSDGTNEEFIRTGVFYPVYFHGDLYSHDDWDNYDGFITEDNLLSSIPTDRMFQFPNISNTEIYSIVILTSIAVSSIAIGGFLGLRAFKKFSWKKRLVNQQKLVDTVNKAKANPTPENLKAAYKATKFYNFKAKLFGWSTFDATNAWFDGPASDDGASLDLDEIKNLIAGDIN
jgi:hypothetical protein